MAGETPQILQTERLFAGRVFAVRSDRLRYADGTVHQCEIVEHAPTYGVIALCSPRELVLVRQYRHPAGRVLWEIPAGTAEPGEDARAGALRELAEETGFVAASIEPLWSLYMTPGFCDEKMDFFVARDLRAGPQSLDEDERIEVGCFDARAALRLFEAGEIADVKTLLALHWIVSRGDELISGSVDRKD